MTVKLSRLDFRVVPGHSGWRGIDAELRTSFLAAAVELCDRVHGRGKVKVSAVPHLQSRSVVGLGTEGGGKGGGMRRGGVGGGGQAREKVGGAGRKPGRVSGLVETRAVSHQTHTSSLLHSLSVRAAAFKDARVLCSLCCCRGNQGKHAAVKSHFHLFPPPLANSVFFVVVVFKSFRHQRDTREGGRLVFHWLRRWRLFFFFFYKSDQ